MGGIDNKYLVIGLSRRFQSIDRVTCQFVFGKGWASRKKGWGQSNLQLLLFFGKQTSRRLSSGGKRGKTSLRLILLRIDYLEKCTFFFFSRVIDSNLAFAPSGKSPSPSS